MRPHAADQTGNIEYKELHRQLKELEKMRLRRNNAEAPDGATSGVTDGNDGRGITGTLSVDANSKGTNLGSQQAGVLYTTKSKLKVRVGCDLRTEMCPELDAGAHVVILEQRALPDGTPRARLRRIALPSATDDALASTTCTPIGWVSARGKDGSETLVQAPERLQARYAATTDARRTADDQPAMAVRRAQLTPADVTVMGVANAADLRRGSRTDPQLGQPIATRKPSSRLNELAKPQTARGRLSQPAGQAGTAFSADHDAGDTATVTTLEAAARSPGPPASPELTEQEKRALDTARHAAALRKMRQAREAREAKAAAARKRREALVAEEEAATEEEYEGLVRTFMHSQQFPAPRRSTSSTPPIHGTPFEGRTVSPSGRSEGVNADVVTGMPAPADTRSTVVHASPSEGRAGSACFGQSGNLDGTDDLSEASRSHSASAGGDADALASFGAASCDQQRMQQHEASAAIDVWGNPLDAASLREPFWPRLEAALSPRMVEEHPPGLSPPSLRAGKISQPGAASKALRLNSVTLPTSGHAVGNSQPLSSPSATAMLKAMPRGPRSAWEVKA